MMCWASLLVATLRQKYQKRVEIHYVANIKASHPFEFQVLCRVDQPFLLCFWEPIEYLVTSNKWLASVPSINNSGRCMDSTTSSPQYAS